MFSNSRLGTDEGRFGYRVHQNEERRKSTYFMIYIYIYISKSHLTHNYSKHLKIYTDGLVKENEQAGADFYIFIPEFKTEKNISTLERGDLYLLQN